MPLSWEPAMLLAVIATLLIALYAYFFVDRTSPSEWARREIAARREEMFESKRKAKRSSESS